MAYKTYTTLSLIFVCGMAAAQEKPEDSCAKIMEYYSSGDLDGALEEAQWCLEALRQVQQGVAGGFFRDEVAGWQRTSLDQGNALGFAATEATYAKDEKTLTVSLIGANEGDALGGFLESIAGAGLAATGTRMRIQQHAAVAHSESGSNDVMITLESGGQLQVASSSASLEEVIAFAEAFPVTELDESR